MVKPERPPGPERRLASLGGVPDERIVEVQEVDHSATPSLLPNAAFASATSPIREPSGYGRSNSNAGCFTAFRTEESELFSE